MKTIINEFQITISGYGNPNLDPTSEGEVVLKIRGIEFSGIVRFIRTKQQSSEFDIPIFGATMMACARIDGIPGKKP